MKAYSKFDLNQTMEMSLITAIFERAVSFMREEFSKGYYPPTRKDEEGEIIPCFCNCQDILDELESYSPNSAVARERLQNAIHGAATLMNGHFQTFGTHHVYMYYTLCDRTVMSGIRHMSAVGFLIK